MTDDNLTNRLSKIERDNIAIVKRYFELFNERQIDALQEILSPDFVAHFEHEEIKGVSNYREKIYDVFVEAIPDIHVDLEDIIADGNHVAVRWNVEGVHRGVLLGVNPSGKIIKFSGMSWYRILDGKIVENWNNSDMSYFLGNLVTELNTLRGILPLCSFCKKICDDKGYWEQVDVYIDKYSEADISHSICPECMKKHYPKEYLSVPPDKK